MSNHYLNRYAYSKQFITIPPHQELGLIIIIPCFDEPHVILTLESLAACEVPEPSVEVILVINESDGADDSLHARNQDTLETCQRWIKSYHGPLLFRVIFEQFPEKHAGVGLARKVGMDEAVRRFEALERSGILVALDADCLVAPNYLKALVTHFQTHPHTPGCSIYFEHPLAGPLEKEIYSGIIAYELHLRYYTHALRFAGHPFAFQTVGSSMAVRSDAYQKQGGMNKRKAGEDFYFLQNIFLLGGFSELHSTCVYPSPRESHRVPFGTGKAISNWLSEKTWDYQSYNYQTFKDLRNLFKQINELRTAPIQALWKAVPPSLQEFIGPQKFRDKLLEIRRQSNTETQFQQRFFAWCNGFFVFKFAHFCRDHLYPNLPVAQAATWLLQEYHQQITPSNSNLNLLLAYRKLDKQTALNLFSD